MKRGELNKRPPTPVRRTRSVSDTSVRRSILAAMALLGVAAFLVLAGRLVKLMLVDHDYYEAKAISNQTRSTRVTASRGAVYDRNMELLAASSSVETIFLDPLQLRQNGVDLDLLAKNLAPILNISEDFIKEQAADTQMRYKVLKRRQGLEVCNQVRAFLNENDITGVYLEQDSLRYYPNGSVASQLPTAPVRQPTRIPPRMSVGKCTYRYIRVKPMSAASQRAGTPSLRFCRQSANAAAKPDAVCPEGKDQPWGRATSVSISGRRSQGRGRANSGFKAQWPASM